jgi:holo-[acyl-carrier protein] synthase
MRVVAVGVDVVDVDRFAAVLSRQPRLYERLFTEAERIDSHGQPERLAARFAMKEAVLKALRVGLGAARWHDIEVVRDVSGAPSVALHGAAASLAEERGINELLVSQSHSDTTATAFVVAQGD